MALEGGLAEKIDVIFPAVIVQKKNRNEQMVSLETMWCPVNNCSGEKERKRRKRVTPLGLRERKKEGGRRKRAPGSGKKQSQKRGNAWGKTFVTA